MTLIKVIKNLKLKTKLILLYVFTILLPMVILSQAIINNSGNKIVNQTTQITQIDVKQLKRNISDLLNGYISISNQICYYDDILKTYLDVSKTYTVLDSLDAYNSYLKTISYYGVNGITGSVFLKVYFLNETLTQDINTFIFADDEIQKSTPYQKAIVADGNVAWGYIKASKRIYASRVLKDNTLKTIGVVSIEIPEERIYSLIQETSSLDKLIMICNDDGEVLTSNDTSLTGGVGSIGDKAFFLQAFKNDSVIFDYKDGGNYKVISETLKAGHQFPDWRIIALIPLDSLLSGAYKIRNTSLLICIAILSISGILFILSLNWIINRIKQLVDNMKMIKEGVFSTISDSGPHDEIGVLIDNFNKMAKSLNTLIHENYEVNLQVKDIALKKREAEIHALQSQINPHFLFNTLESIRMKLNNGVDLSEASAMIFNLAKILRMSLNWQGDISDLAKEISFTKYYLEINKGRYRDKFDYSINVPDNLLDCKVPKLIMQPIVENSIKYGLERKSRFGIISILIWEDEGRLIIEITDNGAGMDEETLSKLMREMQTPDEINGERSIGIKNVNNRIMLHYGSDYGLKIESIKDEGTKVTLTMPVEK